MTIEEMHEVICEHCGGKSCGDDCLIRGICKPIAGRFKDNPKKLEEAYRILKPEDNVNHPSHYTQGGMECIDEMLLIFGKEAVKNFCICNAWKYRKRAMFKNGQEDIDKSDWYINKYKELAADEAVR